MDRMTRSPDHYGYELTGGSTVISRNNYFIFLHIQVRSMDLKKKLSHLTRKSFELMAKLVQLPLKHKHPDPSLLLTLEISFFFFFFFFFQGLVRCMPSQMYAKSDRGNKFCKRKKKKKKSEKSCNRSRHHRDVSCAKKSCRLLKKKSIWSKSECALVFEFRESVISWSPPVRDRYFWG